MRMLPALGIRFSKGFNPYVPLTPLVGLGDYNLDKAAASPSIRLNKGTRL